MPPHTFSRLPRPTTHWVKNGCFENDEYGEREREREREKRKRKRRGEKRREEKRGEERFGQEKSREKEEEEEVEGERKRKWLSKAAHTQDRKRERE